MSVMMLVNAVPETFSDTLGLTNRGGKWAVQQLVTVA
jgi:hypothetical protein